jgi:hypothetical protein
MVTQASNYIMITEIKLLHTRCCDALAQQLHTLISQATSDNTRPLSRPGSFSFHLLDLVQGVVVGGDAGVVHLVEPHHHRVAGVGVLHQQIKCAILPPFSGYCETESLVPVL